MAGMTFIKKLEKARLTGRGGAEFPVATKWLGVLSAKAKNFGQPVYVVCNVSEGEPMVDKDRHILRYHAKEVIGGMRIAMDTLGAEKAFIFIKRKYLPSLRAQIEKYINKKTHIVIRPEDGGYLCGEETTLIEYLEGNRPEPRIKPPFPTEVGLYGCPTLVSNVETFYYVYQIFRDEYRDTRFYSIHGAVKNSGVFELPLSWSIGEILDKTKNTPNFDFFVQIGGGASGDILLPEELNTPLKGAGSIIVYDLKKTDRRKLLKRWIEFFLNENCGKCAPCREGLYRLREELNKAKPDWLIFRAIIETMRDSSFCPLGKSVYTPAFSLIEKIGVK